MSKYLLLYRSERTPAEQFANVTPEQRKAFTKAWTAWDERVGKPLIDPGNPTAEVVDPKAGGDHVAGYAILEAESPDAVEKLLAGHPHVATGGTVGVYEIMQM